jgi:hypothetical protein
MNECRDEIKEVFGSQRECCVLALFIISTTGSFFQENNLNLFCIYKQWFYFVEKTWKRNSSHVFTLKLLTCNLLHSASIVAIQHRTV